MRKPSSGLTQILSENLRFLRNQRGLSQEELAEVCGIHRTYVGSIERGERNVTLSSLELFASALNVSVPRLLMKNLGNNDDDNQDAG
ncbi:helix-turn-helix transcriptional regulator [Oryzomonas japonica]|uniref:Helix-turn-helix transcriptional regulator n=1 Tax=Oryzomonas japonica TaxID=2603858 RepID=A0A7J4ZW33_9BACT|nr:helix-turn-helix transcriptional regulator [Oryzomonas japonica]KAB0667752.1 helix-turn-helix transcriptional regulator [Oryzomonas japonica]